MTESTFTVPLLAQPHPAPCQEAETAVKALRSMEGSRLSRAFLQNWAPAFLLQIFLLFKSPAPPPGRGGGGGRSWTSLSLAAPGPLT